MKDASAYGPDLQTYLKHFFLERYLEQVVFKIGMTNPELVFVDGFSGPWEEHDEGLETTSFKLSINLFRRAANALKQHGKQCQIRCLFIEEKKKRFDRLQKEMPTFEGISCEAWRGRFEELIPRITDFVGNSFSFVFIDPTGWTGFPLERLEPLFGLRGEILINFMYDFVQRFIEHDDPKLSPGINALMGGSDWHSDFDAILENGASREEAIIETYRRRLKRNGIFSYASSVRVMKPTHDRTYFYLVFGTDEVAGMRAFSKVQEKFVEEQETERTIAKDMKRSDRSDILPLFEPGTLPSGTAWYENDRQNALSKLRSELPETIRQAGRIQFGPLLAERLEDPLIWEADVKSVIRELQKTQFIKVIDLAPNKRVPQMDHVIAWTGD